MAKKPSPTAEQIDTFLLAIDSYREVDATLTGWMDDVDPGSMMLCIQEDGLTTHAVFGKDGQIVGNWF
jgi:hypothetical protein